MSEELERYKTDIRRLAGENELLIVRCADLQKLADKFGQNSRNGTERDRLMKQEQERTNTILIDLNREINEERSRNRTLAQRVPELEAELLKLSETNMRMDEQYQRELSTSKGHNDEMKKMLDYQISLKTRQMSQLHEEHERRLHERQTGFRQLEKYTKGLEEKLNSDHSTLVVRGTALINLWIIIERTLHYSAL